MDKNITAPTPVKLRGSGLIRRRMSCAHVSLTLEQHAQDLYSLLRLLCCLQRGNRLFQTAILLKMGEYAPKMPYSQHKIRGFKYTPPSILKRLAGKKGLFWDGAGGVI